MNPKILKKPYFYSAKMAPQKVDKLITLKVAKLITLWRPKGGQTNNSPAYIYIYGHIYTNNFQIPLQALLQWASPWTFASTKARWCRFLNFRGTQSSVTQWSAYLSDLWIVLIIMIIIIATIVLVLLLIILIVLIMIFSVWLWSAHLDS